MKDSFLDNVARYLSEHHQNDIEDALVVLPNRRAGLFLKQYLADYFTKTTWLPRIIATEEFVLEHSGLIKLDSISIVFRFYEVYKEIEGDKADSFDDFLQWGMVLLQDFNEIDQYLIPTDQLFSFINETRALEVWNVDGSELTDTQKNYLAFWQKLPTYYSSLRKVLFKNKECYQGLAFRWVAEHFQVLLNEGKFNDVKQFVFAGFNAINQSEETIIDALIKEKKATLLWDADNYYLNDKVQEAGLFLRRFRKKWDQEQFLWATDHWKTQPKKITITGVNGNIGQSYFLSDLLSNVHDENELKQTAVVLADESLLDPALQSIPDNVEHLNITMGYALENSPLHSLWMAWIKMHENALKYSGKNNSGTYHYKDVIRILNHPFVKDEHTVALVNHIVKFNWVFIASDKLIEKAQNTIKDLFSICFTPWDDNPKIALELQLKWIDKLRERKNIQQNDLDLEYLFKYKTIVDTLRDITVQHEEHITTIKTLKLLFAQLVSKEQVDFYGEPLKGLQVMGVLETRTLDFSKVVMLSANEGTIPAGKSSQSFIPFEIKRKFKLPTHIEKDALFAYHFYRLLQRAEEIDLVYNTDTDSFSGSEKSRFISQMLYELPKLNGNISIKEQQLGFDLKVEPHKVTTIEKTNELIQKIADFAQEKGFSPTALNTFIRCPLDFYYKYILKLDELDEVREKVEADTMGDVIHKVLEEIYTPYVSKVLDAEYLKSMIPIIETKVMEAFKKHHYTDRELSFGKNHLTLSVIVKFIKDFINKEINKIEHLQKSNQYITILALEQELRQEFDIKGRKVVVKGFVDRIDKIGNTIRILDYKTGAVESKDLKLKELGFVTEDASFSKVLQLLIYGLLYSEENKTDGFDIQPGIISFRKLSEGIINLEIEKTRFDKRILPEFKEVLLNKIGSIFDKEVLFEHNSKSTYCNFCDI